MSLVQSLVEAQQEARKNKQSEKLSVLQMALSAIKNEQINALKKEGLSDEEVIGVLSRYVKQLKDAMKDFQAGNRDDLVQKTQQEIDIISTFLPAQLSEEEVEHVIQHIIDTMKPSGPQDFGRVMGSAMQELKGKADGTIVGAIVKKLLTA